jgi:hypothetical protein
VLRVLQGPTWFRSDASKLRFEPWYQVPSCGFLGTENSRNSHEFRGFLDRRMQFRRSGPDCSEVEFKTLLRSGLKNDTSPQNGPCRLTFGYRPRTI